MKDIHSLYLSLYMQTVFQGLVRTHKGSIQIQRGSLTNWVPQTLTFSFLGKIELTFQMFKNIIFSTWEKRNKTKPNSREIIKILLKYFLKGKVSQTSWCNIWHLMDETPVAILQSSSFFSWEATCKDR